MLTTGLREISFPAMGTTAHAVTTAGDEVLAAVRAGVEDLERKWSRFQPESELSRLNRAGSAVVSDETVWLVEHLVEAWRATGGRFDPTMARSIEGMGYDVPFETGLDGDGRLASHPGDGCDEIRIDGSVVHLPVGVRLDPGGLGKGLAADLIARREAPPGEGLLINLGGDLAAAGPGPIDGRWRVEVREPAVSPAPLARVDLPADSGMATSTPMRRRWRRGDELVHHLLDPTTGLPHERVNRLVTVVAADGWWAEAVTKQLAASDPDEATRIVHEAAALIVDPDGDVHHVNGFEEYLA